MTAAPWASSPAIRATMRGNRSRDTIPELALRSALHRRGLRFRVDRAPLPGLRRRADVVFGPTRVAVFVHGCFWHGCPEHYTAPRANREFWKAKVDGNRARDADTSRVLTEAGWEVVVVWEHDDVELAAERVAVLVRDRRKGSAPSAGRVISGHRRPANRPVPPA